MSNQAVTWAYKQRIEPSGAKFVLVTLANYAGADGHCRPGQERLSEETCQSVRAVRGHLATLERLGFIARSRRHRKDGTRTSDEYELVGFTLAAESAGELPATVAGSEDRLPATNVSDYRQQTSKLPADSAAYLNVSEPSVDPSVDPSALAARPPKAPDPLWDALVAEHGFSPTPQTPEHGRWNHAVGIYRRLKVSPATVPRVYALYHQHYPNADDNANAVAGRAEHLLNGARASPGGTGSPDWVPYQKRQAAN